MVLGVVACPISGESDTGRRRLVSAWRSRNQYAVATREISNEQRNMTAPAGNREIPEDGDWRGVTASIRHQREAG